MASVSSTFELTTRLLKAEASRYAIYGVGIALATVVLATLLVCWLQTGALSLAGIGEAQRSNPALWLLDGMPFLFAVWGQYTGTLMAYRASALVMDETAALREQTGALEYQLQHRHPGGPDLGLPNRKALRTAIARALAAPQSEGLQTAVIMIEIEQLQEVDRIMGDEIAEDLMRIAGQRLQGTLSRQQLLAHLGHNEFGLLHTAVRDLDEVHRQALRLQRALDMPVTLGGLHISLQVRIGAAAGHGGEIEADSLMRRAEIAKYAARAEQREYQLYHPELETRGAGKLSLAAELHAALSTQGLESTYAPQLHLASGRCDRLRLYPAWPHPRRGRLLEAELIGLPERGGLLHGFSLWLLQNGLGRLEEWRRQLSPGLVLSLRLPDQALTHLPLSEMLTRLLASHDLPGDALVLEFSESGLRSGGKTSLRHIESLVRQGVGICLEGFGGPGCGLSTLLDFPVTELRMSGSLVRQALQQPRARATLRSGVALAQSLGIATLIGDVEHESQLQLLRELGCTRAEGAQVQPALSTENIQRWLQAYAQPAPREQRA